MQIVNPTSVSVGTTQDVADRKIWLRNIYLLVIALCLNSCLLYLVRDRLRVRVPVEFLLLNLALIANQFVGLILLWYDKIKLSTHVTVYMAVAILLFMLPTVAGGGISLELAAIFLAMITIGNTMLSGKGSFILWLICVGSTVALFWLEQNGYNVGRSVSTPETGFLVFFACLFFSYFPQRILIKESQRNAQLAQASVDALADANEQLRQKQGELKQSHQQLETRITERTAELTHEIKERTDVAKALQESEQRFRALVEGTFAGFAIFVDSHVVMANDVWGQFVHMNSADTLGLSLYDIFDNETAEQVMLRLSLENDSQLEIHGKLKDGEDVSFELISNDTVFRNKPAQIVGLRDISARIRTELKLRETQKIDSLAVLAGGVAHDFNNLLVAMLAQNSLALSILPEDHKAHRHIKKAVKATEQAASLTKQLLAYTGRGHFDVREIQLNELIRENVDLFEAAIPKNVQMRLRLDPRTPEIKADSAQMQQILMNLLLNGAQAIGSEQGEVVISTTLQHVSAEESERWQQRITPIEPGEYVVLEVEDDGNGIAENTLTRIFDPFYTTKPDGRGLGLAATIGIMRGHKAGLEVASKEGIGTIFRLLFPIADDAYTIRYMGAEPIAAGIVDVSVLVIESNYHQLNSFSHTLNEAGAMVYSAETLHDGLTTYRQHAEEITIVMIDLTEPGLKRETVLNELYLHNPDIQVVLTSDDDSGDLVIDDLVSARLIKPISAERLVSTIYDLV